MAKIKKKGTSGQSKNFITRTQAVRKLQISLPDFRKLCIWKGIYPREPRSKKKASKTSNASTTFYYTKDIQYLFHEPLLQKFREQKALEKKIAKALGRGDPLHASRLEYNANRPEKTGKTGYNLDHVIRERYPTFTDALRDLDDCLSMLFLFANLPSTPTIPAKMIARCEKLCLEFEQYLIVSQSLRKSFLSIKGIYYQANIQGQDVFWLVPYRFNQRITDDVDFRILGTFVEFYQTLLGFVNFRLYTSIGLVYPPKFDKSRDDQGAELDAFILERNGVDMIKSSESTPADLKPDPKLQAEIDKLMMQLNEPAQIPVIDPTISPKDNEEKSIPDVIDTFEPAVPGGDTLTQPSYSAPNSSTLFSNFTFFISRESPRQHLEFLLRAFGCRRIGWDAVLGEGAFTHDELDPIITHQIVDRPLALINSEMASEDQNGVISKKRNCDLRVPGRIYVQPQWVWDCVNDGELKKPDLYAPGAELPPHLSPFVTQVHGQYDPREPLDNQDIGDENDVISDDYTLRESKDSEDFTFKETGLIEESNPQANIDQIEALRSPKNVQQFKADTDTDCDSFSGFSDIEEDEDDDETKLALQRQRELEAELTGVAIKKPNIDPAVRAHKNAQKRATKKANEEKDNIERAKIMMSRKKRKILDKMIYSNLKKDAEAETLRSKRRKLESSKKGIGSVSNRY